MTSKKISKTSKTSTIELLPSNHLHMVMAMLKYQSKNKIVSKCLANTFYLKSLLSSINYKANVKPVLVCRKKDGIFRVVVHVILEYQDGTYCDPSWETFSDKSYVYLDSYKQLIEYLDDYYTLDSDGKRDCLIKFLHFTKRAKELNEGDGIGDIFIDYIMNQHIFVCKEIGIEAEAFKFVGKDVDDDSYELV